MAEILNLSDICRRRSHQARMLADACAESGNRAGYVDLIDVASELAWRANVYAPRRAVTRSIPIRTASSFDIDPKGAA